MTDTTVGDDLPDNGTANLAELETAAEQPKAEEPAKEAPKAEEPEAKTEEPPKPKAKTWEQRRIDELTRARRDAERNAEALKAERDAALALVENARRGEEPPERPAQTALPKDEIERRADELATQRAYQRQITSTIEAGDKEFGRDFTDACNTLADMGANERPEFMQIITDTDAGHKVLQHLGQNPEEADKLLRLPPHRMAMEIGRISDRLSKPKEVPVSKAPEPIRPIDSNVDVKKDPSSDDASDEEWFKWRAEQKAKARQGRR